MLSILGPTHLMTGCGGKEQHDPYEIKISFMIVEFQGIVLLLLRATATVIQTVSDLWSAVVFPLSEALQF